MAQLISIYNHPDFDGDGLCRSDYEELKDMWYKENDINKDNGYEEYDIDALIERVKEQKEAI